MMITLVAFHGSSTHSIQSGKRAFKRKQQRIKWYTSIAIHPCNQCCHKNCATTKPIHIAHSHTQTNHTHSNRFSITSHNQRWNGTTERQSTEGNKTDNVNIYYMDDKPIINRIILMVLSASQPSIEMNATHFPINWTLRFWKKPQPICMRSFLCSFVCRPTKHALNCNVCTWRQIFSRIPLSC